MQKIVLDVIATRFAFATTLGCAPRNLWTSKLTYPQKEEEWKKK